MNASHLRARLSVGENLLRMSVVPRVAAAVFITWTLFQPATAAGQTQATFRIIDTRYTPGQPNAEVDILWVYNDGGDGYYKGKGKGVEFYVHKTSPGYGNAQKGTKLGQTVDMKNGTGLATLTVPLPEGIGPGSQLVLTGVWPTGHQWGVDEGRQGGHFFIPPQTGPLDLNKATAADLDALPGIGPKLAQRIIDFRGQLASRSFSSVDDLTGVSGISASKLTPLKPLVGVGDQPPPSPQQPVAMVINVNRAKAEQIALLPGVTPQQAQAIVDYRKTLNGKKFSGTYQLTSVQGVDQNLVNKIFPYISFHGRSKLPKATAQQNARFFRGSGFGFRTMPWRRAWAPRKAWSRTPWTARRPSFSSATR